MRQNLLFAGMLAAGIALWSEAAAQPFVHRQIQDVTAFTRDMLTNNSASGVRQFLGFSGNATNGEANVGQNLGSGVGLYAGKVNLNLQFKSLRAGSGIVLSNYPTFVEIWNTGGTNGVGGGGQDVTIDQLGPVNFAGRVSFAGPIARTSAHGKQVLNWSTMNSADFSTNADFAVTFAGSWNEGDSMEYWVTNTSVSSIVVTIPESKALSKTEKYDPSLFTDSVEIQAQSVAKISWIYDGDVFRLSAGGANDHTLEQLSTSGYFRETAGTIDDTETTVVSFTVPDHHGLSIDVTLTGLANTNTHKAGFHRFATFFAAGGAITQVSTTEDLATKKTAGASAWDVVLGSSGNTLLVDVVGDPVHPVNWTANGFAYVFTNAPLVCSRQRDTWTGSVGEATFGGDTYYWLATAFLASENYSTCGLDLYISKTGTPADATAEIWSWDEGANKPNVKIGTASDAVSAASGGATLGYVPFDNLRATLVAGTRYAIVFKTAIADDAMNHWNWAYAFVGTAKSIASNDDGMGWASVSDGSAFKYKIRSN